MLVDQVLLDRFHVDHHHVGKLRRHHPVGIDLHFALIELAGAVAAEVGSDDRKALLLQVQADPSISCRSPLKPCSKMTGTASFTNVAGKVRQMQLHAVAGDDRGLFRRQRLVAGSPRRLAVGAAVAAGTAIWAEAICGREPQPSRPRATGEASTKA